MKLTRRQLLRLTALAPLPTLVVSGGALATFGESLTFGLNATPRDQRSYAARLAQHWGLVLDNKAIGGQTITEQLQRQFFLWDGPADVALTLAGFNDMRFSTPLDSYAASLETALAHLEARAARVVVGNCVRMTPAGYARNQGSDAAVDAINAVIARVLASHPRCIAVDVCAVFDPSLDMDPADEKHPDNGGHAIIAGAFLRALDMRRVALPLVAT